MNIQSLFYSVLVCGFLWVNCMGCTIKKDPVIKTLTPNGSWDWFAAPRSVYISGDYNKSYMQWVSSSGRLYGGSYNHSTRQVKTITLKEDWGRDDRNIGSWLVLPDNRLMAFYSEIDRNGLFCRTTVESEDITGFDEEITVISDSLVTGCQPVYLTKEDTYYVFFSDSLGNPSFVTSEDGEIWTDPETLIEIDGDVSDTRFPYFRVVSNGEDTIHFAIGGSHPENSSDAFVYYLKYENSEFSTSNGGFAGTIDELPIATDSLETVYDGSDSGGGAWIWDLALDDSELPVIAYVRFRTSGDHRYCYGRYTGSGWLNVEVVKGGSSFVDVEEGGEALRPYYSGGMALDHLNPSVLFLSRKVNDYFEVEKWTTTDGGDYWYSSAVTSESEVNNVRPLRPVGYDGGEDFLMWMSGGYNDSIDFDTELKMLLPPEEEEDD